MEATVFLTPIVSILALAWPKKDEKMGCWGKSFGAGACLGSSSRRADEQLQSASGSSSKHHGAGFHQSGGHS